MRFRLLTLLCLWAPTAGADLGIGALVGDNEAGILVPIRFSSLLLEPQVKYLSGDSQASGSDGASVDGYGVGVGLFGLKATGDNLSIYYGARLADEKQESESQITDPITALPLGSSKTEIEGYSVTPAVGFQYAVDSIMVGAEIGWQYSEADLELNSTFGGFSSTYTSSETTRGTVANIVFRYFFGPN